MKTRRMRWLLYLSVLAVFCTLFVPTGAAAQQPVALKFASFGMGSGWYVMAGAMAESIKGYLPSGSTVDALPKSGGIGNPMVVSAGQADIGFAFPITAKWAFNGMELYDKKLTNLRAVAGGLDTYYVLGAVRADLPVNSWADVKAKKIGLRLCTQPKGSQSEVAARHILGEYGITFKDLETWGGKMMPKGFGEMVPALKDGAIDGFLMVATPRHPTWTEAAISRPLKFIALEDPVIAKLNAKYGYNRSVLPAKMYHGQDKDVNVIGFPTCLIARDDVPAEAVYATLKAISENKAKIQAAYKAFEVFDPKVAWQPDLVGGLPLHPGAEKFFKEKGYMK